ncbi:macrophage mannose receptor 1 [Plakobranchus ocellatus]|uniref:Macrophage mannose receptor 1 n=1 Tax=Plakobranchus ocellatus TaxID=259542 RepID=A0AAV4D4M0_9GAST|nr:macrophage mannose receptor 1 [Plakobranchus ocellatus]
MLAVVIFLTIWIFSAPSHAGESTDSCSSAPIQGGTKLHKPYRGKCYTFYAHPDSKKQYWEAQKECEKNQGNLAMPKTKEANQFLVDSLLGYGIKEEVFIGLDDMDDEEEFKWKDGSMLMKPTFYENFASGNGIFRTQGGRSRDCVILDPTSGEWRDIDCRRNVFQRLTGYKKKRRLYVCENEIDELSVVSKPTTISDAGDKNTQHSDTPDPSKVALPKDDQQNDSDVSSASAANTNSSRLNTLDKIETMTAMTLLMYLVLEILTKLPFWLLLLIF